MLLPTAASCRALQGRRVRICTHGHTACCRRHTNQLRSSSAGQPGCHDYHSYQQQQAALASSNPWPWLLCHCPHVAFSYLRLPWSGVCCHLDSSMSDFCRLVLGCKHGSQIHHLMEVLTVHLLPDRLHRLLHLCVLHVQPHLISKAECAVQEEVSGYSML